MSGEPEILILPDAEATSSAAADLIARRLDAAVQARGRADWATTGGSTPLEIYRQLAASPLRERVPWDRVHIWWGDDRWVPRSDVLSNVQACDDILLNLPGRRGSDRMGSERGAPVPVDNVHAIPIDEALDEGRSPAWAAATYEATLRAAGLPMAAGWPVFDLVLLGVGPDGHVLSVFPESTTWNEPAWVQAVPAPVHIAPHVDRVTLHPAVITVARLVLAVVHGARKAEIVGTVMGPERDVRRWPAQLARRTEATWMLDAAAAARLPEALRG